MSEKPKKYIMRSIEPTQAPPSMFELIPAEESEPEEEQKQQSGLVPFLIFLAILAAGIFLHSNPIIIEFIGQ